MRVRSHVLAGYIGLAALAEGAAAQSAPPRAGGTQEPAGRFVIGGGADLLATERGPVTPGLALQAGYERRLGASPFGLRVEGTLWQRGTRYDGAVVGPTGPQPVGPVARIRTISGANLLATYRVGVMGAVRPYLLGGVGVYQSSLRNETDWTREGADGGAGRSKITVLPPVRINGAALTGGLGFDVPMGRRAFFVEARATVHPASEAARARGPIQGITTPLTAGFKF
jgi:hypothetical protein